MLTDAELVLGLSRHLGAYAASPAKSALGQLEFAGQLFEMAWRLRSSGVSSARRVAAIAEEAAIGRRLLIKEILPGLESVGWLDLRWAADGTIAAIDERIPPPSELVVTADQVLNIALPTQAERAALVLLRETSRLPLVTDAALA